MNKKLVAWVKSGLRRMWGKSIQRRSALLKAKIEYGKYRCASCEKIHRRKDIQVDHRIPVGRFTGFDTYIERLFCNVDGLDVLCKGCHKLKTKKDVKKMSNKKRKTI